MIKQAEKEVKLITQNQLFNSSNLNYNSSNLDHIWYNVQHPVIIAVYHVLNQIKETLNDKTNRKSL